MDREIIKIEKHVYCTKICKISKVVVKVFTVYNRPPFPKLRR